MDIHITHFPPDPLEALGGDVAWLLDKLLQLAAAAAPELTAPLYAERVATGKLTLAEVPEAWRVQTEALL
ncbi:MAG: hypothetical protein LBT60_00770 [Oscillospiraceae bacterium]|jgi:hypothetical protein|nr:hypothetical protein [Oscillospiraceae bacterium]